MVVYTNGGIYRLCDITLLYLMVYAMIYHMVYTRFRTNFRSSSPAIPARTRVQPYTVCFRIQPVDPSAGLRLISILRALPVRCGPMKPVPLLSGEARCSPIKPVRFAAAG